MAWHVCSLPLSLLPVSVACIGSNSWIPLVVASLCGWTAFSACLLSVLHASYVPLPSTRLTFLFSLFTYLLLFSHLPCLSSHCTSRLAHISHSFCTVLLGQLGTWHDRQDKAGVFVKTKTRIITFCKILRSWQWRGGMAAWQRRGGVCSLLPPPLFVLFGVGRTGSGSHTMDSEHGACTRTHTHTFARTHTCRARTRCRARVPPTAAPLHTAHTLHTFTRPTFAPHTCTHTPFYTHCSLHAHLLCFWL